MVAVMLAGPAVQMGGVVAWLCAFAIAACAYALAGKLPEGRSTRLVIGLLLACAVVVVAQMGIFAAIYDLDYYCRTYWWDVFTCGF